jgi:hypothetical protein
MPLQKQYQSHDGFNYRLLGKSWICHAVVAANPISFCFDKYCVLSRQVAWIPFSCPLAFDAGFWGCTMADGCLLAFERPTVSP